MGITPRWAPTEHPAAVFSRWLPTTTGGLPRARCGVRASDSVPADPTCVSDPLGRVSSTRFSQVSFQPPTGPVGGLLSTRGPPRGAPGVFDNMRAVGTRDLGTRSERGQTMRSGKSSPPRATTRVGVICGWESCFFLARGHKKAAAEPTSTTHNKVGACILSRCRP